jgi:hypothetical protein
MLLEMQKENMFLQQKDLGKRMYQAKNVASFFNTSEGFEEGAQFAIQTGTQHYFDKKIP